MAKSFAQWWKRVNALVAEKIGMDADCMPDLIFVRDLYDAGLTPAQCRDDLFAAWVDDGCMPADLTGWLES